MRKQWTMSWACWGLACAGILLGYSTAFAGILAHNGTTDSNPPGNGDTSIFVNQQAVGEIAMVFGQDAEHAILELYDPPATWRQYTLFISNATAQSWGGYVVTVGLGDLYGFNNGQIPEVDPLTTAGTFAENKVEFLTLSPGVSLLGGFVNRDADPALTVIFSDPVDPGEGFGLSFYVLDVGQVDEGFILTQKPLIVPEPATAMLAISSIMIFAVRRRF